MVIVSRYASDGKLLQKVHSRKKSAQLLQKVHSCYKKRTAYTRANVHLSRKRSSITKRYMKRFLFTAALMVCCMCGMAQTYVRTWEQLTEALNTVLAYDIILDDDIIVHANSDTEYSYKHSNVGNSFSSEHKIIDLNGHRIARYQNYVTNSNSGDPLYMLRLDNSKFQLTFIDSSGGGSIEFHGPQDTDRMSACLLVASGTLNLDGVTVMNDFGKRKYALSGNGNINANNCTITSTNSCHINLIGCTVGNDDYADTSDNTCSFFLSPLCTGMIVNTKITGIAGELYVLKSLAQGNLYINGERYSSDRKWDKFKERKFSIQTRTRELDIPVFTVTGKSTDESMGTVNGSGSYRLGELYTLTAIPKENHKVSYWGSPYHENDMPRYVGMAIKDTKHVAQFFEIPKFNVTYEVKPEGAATLIGEGTYLRDENVNLRFIAKDGYTVTQAYYISFRGNPIYYNLSGDVIKNIDEDRHIFIVCKKAYNFNVVPNNSAMGVVRVTTPTGKVVTPESKEAEGRNYHLTASPRTGYRFSHWNDGCFNAERDICVDKDINLEAIFVTSSNSAPSYGIKIMGLDVDTRNYNDVLHNGTVTYDDRTKTLTLNNAHLTSTNKNNPPILINGYDGDFTIKLLGENTIDNHYMPSLVLGNEGSPYKFNVDIVGPGTLKINNKDADAIWCNTNTFLNIIQGAYIDILSGTVYGKSGSRGMYVSQSKLYVAGLPGKNTVTGFNTIYFSGVGIVNSGLKFNAEKKAITNSSGQYYTGDVLIASQVYIEYYRVHTLTLFANDDNMGTVLGEGKYQYGDNVEIKALPTSDEYEFVKWSDGNTQAERTITMGTGNKTLQAIFQRVVPVTGGFLHVKPNEDFMGTVDYVEGWYPEGSRIVVSATNKRGFVFDSWSDGVTADTRNVFMGSSDINLTANFVHMQTVVEPNGINMGLPSRNLWSDINLGAESIYDEGDFYAWGNIFVPSDFTSNADPYCENGTYTKYNKADETLDDADDPASVFLNGEWVMPTPDEFAELLEYSNVSFDAQNNCYVLTSKVNGNKLHFPKAFMGEPNTNGAYYWTNRISSTVSRAEVCNISGNPANSAAQYQRTNGAHIRPVKRVDPDFQMDVLKQIYYMKKSTIGELTRVIRAAQFKMYNKDMDYNYDGKVNITDVNLLKKGMLNNLYLNDILFPEK